MASIIKRGKSYSVVHYEGEGKDRHQVWESGLSYSAAKTRKVQLEMEEANNTHIDQNNITVSEFLHEFLQKYGEKKWVASTYDGNVGLLENYVYPYLGDKKLRSIRGGRLLSLPAHRGRTRYEPRQAQAGAHLSVHHPRHPQGAALRL